MSSASGRPAIPPKIDAEMPPAVRAIDTINRPRKPIATNRLQGSKIGKTKAAAKLKMVRCVSGYVEFLCFSNLNMPAIEEQYDDG